MAVREVEERARRYPDGRVGITDLSHRRATAPIKGWAVAGGVILAFEIYILGRWITGPYFRRVSAGVSEPPEWMKAVLNTAQVVSIPIALVFLYWFLIRPWRKDGRVTTDGLLCVAFVFLSWQDPMSSYFGHWFTYNSYLFNRGSWVYELPGWLSFGEPGAGVASPILVWAPLYIYVFLGLSMLGTAIMRRAKTRWPQLGPIQLLLICYAVLSFSSVPIEGLFYMKLGFYQLSGAWWPVIGSGSYHQWPLVEALAFGGLFTPLAALRYFKNDRGETLAERGLSGLSVGKRAQTGLRFLALSGFVQVAMFIGYNVPMMWFGAHAKEWPKDVQTRSYFTNGMCGEGTDRVCPGQGIPLLNSRATGGNAVRIKPDGTLVLEGGEPPHVYPLDRGRPGPDD